MYQNTKYKFKRSVLQWLHLFRIKRVAKYTPNEAAKKKLPTMNLTLISK